MLKYSQRKMWWKNKKEKNLGKRGFTLIELLMVVGIIGILSGIVMTGVRNAREVVNVVVAGQQQKLMTRAVELYYDDMGFYPPDVNRGWDPGFEKALPWNADVGTNDEPEGGYTTSGADCSHCPSNWEAIAEARWSGPYLTTWPRFTPWKGKYDYNYWPEETDRSGCILDPGIYVGVQGNYQNKNTIPDSAEDKMIEKRYDSEDCKNGESQMLLYKLDD